MGLIKIKRAQKETFWGLSLGSDPELSHVPQAEDGNEAQGLLSNEIKTNLEPVSSARPVPRDERAPTTVLWSFSDDRNEAPAADENDD